MTLSEIEKDLYKNHKLTGNKELDNKTLEFFKEVERILA